MKKKRDFKYRTRLSIFFAITMFIVVSTGLYSYLSINYYMEKATDIYEASQKIIDLDNVIEEMNECFMTYVSKQTSKASNDFYKMSSKLQSQSFEFNKDNCITKQKVRQINLASMVWNYSFYMTEAVKMLRINGEIDSDFYEKAIRCYSYIKEYMQEIMSTDLVASTQKYADIQKKIDILTIKVGILGLVAIIIVVTNIIIFSKEITKPINKLANITKCVADNDFDNEFIDKKYRAQLSQEDTKGEVAVLYENFEKMTSSVAKYLAEAKSKRKLKEKLDAEREKKHQMEAALREAELKALQSQVDPHFIFNTINIGSKIAMLNDDDVTCEYLENAADIFRYNLKGLDSYVALKAEIDNATSYMKLLQTRFGDILRFDLDIENENDLKKVILPKMTLQPLVENAYIHGISKNEDGGTILIKTHNSEEEKRFYVTVANTGEPIKKEIIDAILYDNLKNEHDNDISSSTEKKHGHTTGIGVTNVLKRLRIYFRMGDVLDIKYENGMNHFVIKIPLDEHKE